jgi:hypothetical protein
MSSPEVIKKDMNIVLKEIKGKVPYYTPEWAFVEGSDSDPGVALSKIFAHMSEIAIKKLNDAPQRHFLSFLETINASLIPARPARVPLTFLLSKGTPENVLVPALTQAAGKGTDGKPMLFETEKNIIATPSKLVSVFSITDNNYLFNWDEVDVMGTENERLKEYLANNYDVEWVRSGNITKKSNVINITSAGNSVNLLILEKTTNKITLKIGTDTTDEFAAKTENGKLNIYKQDEIFDLTKAIDGKGSSEFFGLGKNLQEHILYIGDKNRLNVSSAKIGIKGSGIEKLSDVANFSWEYGAEVTKDIGGKEVKIIEWRIFSHEIETNWLKNWLPLIINEKEPISEIEINGIKSRWIRCRVINSSIAKIKDTELSGVNLSTSPYYSNTDTESTSNYSLRAITKTIIPDIKTADFPKPPDALDSETSQNIKASSGSEFIKPDLAFTNDVPVDIKDITVDIYPFGKKPQIYNTFYIACDDAFSKAGYEVQIKFKLTPGKTGEPGISAKNEPQLSWEYWDGMAWSYLKVLKSSDNSSNISLDNWTVTGVCNEPPKNDVTMTIESMPAIKPTTVNGQKKHWIRVRLIGGDYGKEYIIKENRVKPEPLFNWDKLIKEDQENKEKLSKFLMQNFSLEWVTADKIKKINDTTITATKDSNSLSLTLNTDTVNTNVNLEINTVRKYAFIVDKERDIYQPESLCPPIKIEPGSFCPPTLSDLRIKYIQPKNQSDNQPTNQPEYIFSKNNILFKNCSDELYQRKTFKPFESIPNTYPTVYFGFDKPIKGGPISLFVSIDENIDYGDNNRPLLKWQYLSKNGKWIEPDVLDETKGLTKSEIVQFVISGEMASEKLFSKNDLFWIRAQVMQNPAFELKDIQTKSKLLGLYLNSAWALQSRTVSNEIKSSSTGESGQAFRLVNAPVISEKILVNEFGTLTEMERKELGSIKYIEEKKDESGNVTEFWVKWDEVPYFFDSGSKDRHYMIDRTSGEIRFGDGIRGMVPSIGNNNINAIYSTGGGKNGNIPATKISKLQSTITNVDKVYNHVASDGGADIEDVKSLIERAPFVLKHRNRAVALLDYQMLVKEASNKIARVKILPNLNAKGEHMPGTITIVIVPQSPDLKPMPTPELRHIVDRYIKERCSNLAKLNVIQPTYVIVKISAIIVTDRVDAIPVIEQKAKSRIIDFLHPLYGGVEGKGWDFGAVPCISDIFPLLEKIDYVDHVSKITVQLYNDSNSKLTEIKRTDNFKLPADTLLCSGEHEISAKWIAGSG